MALRNDFQENQVLTRPKSSFPNYLGQQCSVAYEQQGTDAQEAEYVELELENRPAGKYLLKVTVRDVNSGETAEKDAGFIIAK